MQIFFSSLASLEHFTHSLETISQDQACQYCHRNNQWVAHGYIYKQQSIDQRNIVGKRILCANRYQKTGCGRTRQLYLHTTVPRRRYDINALVTFVMLLLKELAVQEAYRYATNNRNIDTRNAWRWLSALYAQLGQFRSMLTKQEDVDDTQTHHRSRRLAILRPTLRALFALLPDKEAIQLHQQRRFF